MTFQLLEASQETGIDILGALKDMIEKTGFAAFDKWQYPVMLVIACVLIYLAVGKKYEPLLLLPIAFGMLLANLPFGGIMDPPSDANGNVGGLLYYLHLGVELKIFPCLIFMSDDGFRPDDCQPDQSTARSGCAGRNIPCIYSCATYRFFKP